MSKIVRYSLIVSGRVQGVGFRYQVQKLAGKLHLFGFVRNLPGGDVYIEVQGEEATIASFQAAIKNDLFYAKVTDIKVEALEIVPEDTKFKVKY